MKQTFKTSIFIYEGEEEHEIKVLLKGWITMASPEVHTLPNGDPGYPGDPGGVELYSVTSENPLFDKDKLSDETWNELEQEFENYYH
jgi:hypothetical protein